MKSDSNFIAEIVSNWENDEPRHEYAAWLDRQSRTPAAEFMRTQCEWDSSAPDDPHFHELGRREFELRERLSDQWLDRLAGVPDVSLKEAWSRCIADASCLSTAPGRRRARRAARNLMRRARHNVSHLTRRLFDMGYRFVFPEHAHVRVSARQFARITDFQIQKHWTFPVSLTAFLLEVGSVNLMGTHPDWPFTSYYFDDIESRETPCVISDPMVVDAWTLEWLLPFDFDIPDGTLRIEVAPDNCLKSHVAGCGAQAVNFKNNALEATIEDHAAGEADREFVAYLENAFSWCGFPGFEYDKPAPMTFLDENLRTGLLQL